MQSFRNQERCNEQWQKMSSEVTHRQEVSGGALLSSQDGGDSWNVSPVSSKVTSNAQSVWFLHATYHSADAAVASAVILPALPFPSSLLLPRTSMVYCSKMRSCRKISSLIFRSWNNSSICTWASSSCWRTDSIWLIELVWGVLLLDTAESLWQSTGRRERGGPCCVKSDGGAGWFSAPGQRGCESG